MTTSPFRLPARAARHAGAAAFAAIAFPAQAMMTEPQVQAFSVSPGSPQVLAFETFESSLGELTGVSIDIASSYAPEFDAAVAPRAPFAEGEFLSFSSIYTFEVAGDLGENGSAPGNILLFSSCFYSVQGGCDPAPRSRVGGVNGDFSAIFALLGPDKVDLTDASGPAFFIRLGLEAAVANVCAAPGVTCDLVGRDWAGTLSVSYSFEIPTAPAPEVPLPATLPLMAGGLGLLSAAGRRRRG